jgi:hypothetical protein
MRAVTQAPAALDIGLCLLTIEPVQLSLNQAYAIQALLNASERTRLCLEIDLGCGPALARLIISGASPDIVEER